MAPRHMAASRWHLRHCAVKLGWPTDGPFWNGLQGCLATASPGLGFYRPSEAGSYLTSLIVRVDSLQNGGGKLETLGRACPFWGTLSEPGQRGA